MQNAAIIVLAILDIILVSLSQIALWQRKEYRLDRMRSYLNSPEGSLTKQWPLLIAGLLVAVGWIFDADYAGIASLAAVFIAHAMRSMRKGVTRPVLTTRSGLVLLLTVLACMVWGVYIIIPDTVLALQLATLVFFVPAIVALVVFLSAIPTAIQKQIVIASAKKLRVSLVDLIAIGITGSVGKTSTKTYLLHILGGESQSICATSEHRNAPYVVALDMISRLTPKVTTYIAEMGAYKKGEVQELAEFVQPKIGVVIAITNQHAALFGSLENLATAKWELINALPVDGIAVLNADDKNIVKKAKGLKKKIVWYSLQEKNPLLEHASVIGNGQRSCVLAAVTVARLLNVPESVIVKRLATLPVLPQTMELKVGKAGSRIIDDSYSASEASVMNAIEYMQSIPDDDNRLVMVPIIELGKQGPVVHERIGKALAGLHAHVFMYGDAYKQNIQKGLGKSPKAIVVWNNDPQEMAKEVSQDMKALTTVVLEGRIPDIVRSNLL